MANHFQMRRGTGLIVMGRERLERLERNREILRQGRIVGRLRTVHNHIPDHIGEPVCLGFSYGDDLTILDIDIPFSSFHKDINALSGIPSGHFIVGCINYSRNT